MSKPLTRRRLLTAGLATVAGVAGLAAAERIADRYGFIPPDSGGVWGPGETLTYAAQRLLMSRHSMAREFSPSEISRAIPVTGTKPHSEDYYRMVSGGFHTWRLAVDGLVARPGVYTLDQIRRLPIRSQITHQACEEGWSFIAQWTGTPLSNLLALAGPTSRARYAVFFTMDDIYDSLDLPDAYHPQTFLAWGLNGKDLDVDHGAPLRLRVARQLGYKSVKYLSRITLVESLRHVEDGMGSVQPASGYSWFAGI